MRAILSAATVRLRSALLFSAAVSLSLAIGLTTSAHAETEKRVALVIGNGDYRHAPKLANPVGDAHAVADSLRRLGFEVIEGYNLDAAAMRSSVANFSQALTDSRAALVYYAGHGVAADDDNFLLPVDADLKTAADLDFQTVGVSLVMKQMHRDERVNVIMLDACRNNPFADALAKGHTRAVIATRGLARIDGELSRGSLIAFASDPNSVALDGAPGDHSPFTKALLHHIEDPGVSIDDMMSDVRSEVYLATRQKQTPWVNTSLIGKFRLNPEAAKVEPAPAAPVVAGLDKREELFWTSAQQSGGLADFQAYLDAFPNGAFAALARNRVAALTVKIAPPAPQPPAEKPAEKPAPQVAAAPVPDSRLIEIRPIEPQALSDEDAERALALNVNLRRELQARLVVIGIDPGARDGDFSGKTRDAIRTWQKRRTFKESGFINAQELAALREESEGPYRHSLEVRPTPAAPVVVRPVLPAIAIVPPHPIRPPVFRQQQWQAPAHPQVVFHPTRPEWIPEPHVAPRPHIRREPVEHADRAPSAPKATSCVDRPADIRPNQGIFVAAFVCPR